MVFASRPLLVRHFPLPILALLAALLACAPAVGRAQALPAQSIGPLQADKDIPTDAEEVQRLVSAGRPRDALARADQALAKNPRNAQIRFMRAVILVDLKDLAGARAAFEKLTEEFPELPEPYNNLAVLYAADGQLESAKKLLETALLVAPNYGTAYENLGDIYLQLAADAYQRAVKLEPNNRQAGSKLALSRELISKTRAPCAECARPSGGTK